MEEEWRPIADFPDYEVSNLGRVKSNRYRSKDKIIISRPSQDYQRVALQKDKKQYNKSIHRLVAEAFLDNSDNKPHVDHINRIRSDNRVCNLRWVTIQENALNRSSRTENRCIYYREKQGQQPYYEVQIVRNNQKLYNKTFHTLKEAIAYRDSVLQ
jgi:hypothetical protein